MTDSGAGGTRGRQRAFVLAMVVLLAASAVVAGVGAVAAGSTTEATADASEENPIKFVYVNASTDAVTFVRADGTEVRTSKSADAVGPMTDLDSDGLLEAPYVTSQGKLRTIDRNGESRLLDSNIPYSSTKVGVGDWTEDGEPEVLYPGPSNNYIHYANVSGTPTRVAQEKAKSVLGVADFDGTGGKDIVYIGTSSGNLHYYDGRNATDTDYQGFSSGHTAGAPVDVYQNGTYWVPAVDGSSIPEIVNASNYVQQFRTNSENTKASPVAGVDWTGNDTLEIIHLEGSDLAYTNASGGMEKIENVNGATMGAVKTAGVAGVASYPGPLSVSDFEANATGDQNVTVNVTTNQTLSELDVTLSGPENATLTLGAFEQTGTNPYSYTATYDGSTDGEYTATVERAASAGDSVSSAGSDTASVDEVGPVLNSVNLTDATDGDESVAPGDTIEVTANATSDVGAVTANLSAFDAGSNVSLSHESGDTYNWTGEVGENASAGDQSANVTVSDGQGNTVSNVTGTLSVDTSELAVELADNRTVAVDEQVEFSPQSVENASGDVTYEWEFGDGVGASGETVNHTYDATGDYVVNLTVTDGTNDTANASMNVTVQVPTAIESANLTDVADGNGIVVPGDRIEVAANVTGDVDTVVANLSALDAGTVDLNESGGVYNWTGEVGENATDGNWSVNVTATGEVGDDASAHTNALEVDTDELAVTLDDSRTVQVGETYEYSPQSVSNTTGDVAYNWTFGNGDNATGRTVGHAYESTGTYTVELNASDDSGDTANASMAVEVVDVPIVESVNLSDEANENGIVAPGDTVEVVATVSGDATSVTANLSAFGANSSVELNSASGNTYNRTVEVESNATDGEQSVTVTATGSDSTDSAATGALTVDTDTLDVSLNDSRTVDVGEQVEFSPTDVNAAVGDVDYEWEFASSTVKSGKTVTYAFDSAATYEVVLTASDGSNDTVRASMKVDVVSTATTDDSTSDGSTDGGSGGSLDSGGGTDAATETTDSTSTEGTETSTATPTSTQTATGTETTTEDPQTATEEATATSEPTDRTPTTNESDAGPNPGADQTPGEAPGFGAVAALLALVAAAGLALRE